VLGVFGVGVVLELQGKNQKKVKRKNRISRLSKMGADN